MDIVGLFSAGRFNKIDREPQLLKSNSSGYGEALFDHGRGNTALFKITSIIFLSFKLVYVVEFFI